MNAPKKAARTGRWAETMFRALTWRVARRWRFVSFRGAKGGEWRGVVDVLAVRKRATPSANGRSEAGDLFEFVLVQLKGGQAPPPSSDDIRRLKAVAKHYRAKAVVLYSWNRGKVSSYQRLNRRGEWVASTAQEIFG